ncbi:hypothetical protein BU17DRAFT_60011 [Hysterangium stoloniferum]|nr:hypothetical protein BU17DRAFT_60011 [Hysterangium stoloniferum]
MSEPQQHPKLIAIKEQERWDGGKKKTTQGKAEQSLRAGHSDDGGKAAGADCTTAELKTFPLQRARTNEITTPSTGSTVYLEKEISGNDLSLCMIVTQIELQSFEFTLLTEKLSVIIAEGCGPETFILRELIISQNVAFNCPTTVISAANALTIFYDAAICVATWYYMWSLVRTIFSWKLQTILTDNRNLKGLLSLIERPVSALLALLFFLDLCDRNAHPNATSQTRDQAIISSFNAAARNISDAIIEDLGDPEDALRRSEAERKELSPTVDLVEFPWAAGNLEQLRGLQRNTTSPICGLRGSLGEM